MKALILLTAFTALGVTALSGSILETCNHQALIEKTPRARDEKKWSCVKSKESKDSLSLSKCLQIAQSLESFVRKDEAIRDCLFSFQIPYKKDQCFVAVKQIKFADSADLARESCIEKFNIKLSRNECLKESNNMRIPINRQRSRSFCLLGNSF